MINLSLKERQVLIYQHAFEPGSRIGCYGILGKMAVYRQVEARGTWTIGRFRETPFSCELYKPEVVQKKCKTLEGYHRYPLFAQIDDMGGIA